MSLIRRIATAREVRSDVAWGGVPPFPVNSQQPGSSTYAGVPLTTDSALRHAAVWACVRLISGTLGQMPLEAVRYDGNIAKPVGQVPGLLTSPSGLIPRSAWVEAVLTSLLLRGNAYGRVTEYNASGTPTRIELINPEIVRPELDKATGRVVYYITVGGERTVHERWPMGDIWHVPGLLLPGGFVGLSPIEYAKQSIGQGLGAEKFGAQWFGEGGVPAAILTTDQPVTEEQASTVKARFMQAVKGRREPAVLGAGVKYEQIQVAPNESQFIDAQRWSAEQVCRVYGIDPTMLGVSSGSGSTVTYENRESRVSDFLAFGIGPWQHRVEEALTTLMPRPVFVKFKTGAILRSDIQTRYQTYAVAAQIQQATGSPLLTTDEMRALENLPPLPDVATPGGPNGSEDE